MYTKVERETKRIITKTYKQLTKASLEQVIKDVKKYCDTELIIIPNTHDFGYIPIPIELIRKIIVEQEPDNYFINTDTRVYKQNPEYNPDLENSVHNQPLQTYWHTRYEEDYEGTYETWSEFLEVVINDYIWEHDEEYDWETVKITESEQKD